MKKKFFKRLLAAAVTVMMLLPFVPSMIVFSDPGSDILYENSGPIVVDFDNPWSVGDDTWTDYEWVVDVTPDWSTGDSYFALEFRSFGGNGYRIAPNREGQWDPIQFAGGGGVGIADNVPWPPGYNFNGNDTIRYRFVAEGETIRRYSSLPGNPAEPEILDRTRNLSGLGAAQKFLNGGVGVSIASWQSPLKITLSNITVRDLSGSGGGDPDPDPVNDILYENEGPVVVGSGEMWSVGDESWTDYEWTADITPAGIDGGGFVMIIRDVYYSFIWGENGNAEWCWTALSHISGANTGAWDRIAFAAGNVTSIRFRAEGDIISLYYTYDAGEQLVYSTSIQGFGGTVMSGGIGIESRGANTSLTLNNITVRDLSGSGGGGDPDPDPEPGVVYRNAGPVPLPVVFGDNTWEDYEFEFDITPISGNNFRVSLRGGSVYSWINASDSRSWVGMQPQSGSGGFWPDQPAIPFAYGEATSIKYRIEGTVVTLSFKEFGSEDWTINWTQDISSLTPNASGGVSITTEGLNATLGNIVARDLKGNIIPIEPDPGDKDGRVVVDITEPFTAGDGDSAWYGQTTWKDYTVETTLSNITETGTAEWPNFQYRLRSEAGAYYYIFINGGGAVNLQDSITWSNLESHWLSSGGPSAGNSVDYKFEVMGNTVKVYANDALLYTYAETRDALSRGQIGWATQGVTATVESLKITLFDDEGGTPGEPVTSGPVNILSPRVPAAGVYPVSAYKYRADTWDNSIRWGYNQTIVWEPAIQHTFLPNTAYKATVTLVPENFWGTPAANFSGRTIDDVGGIYLSAAEYASAQVSGGNLVITFDFPPTAGEIAEWEEFKNTLFFDDFSGTRLDLNKWDNPAGALEGQARAGNSDWKSSNVSVRDGHLWLRYAKENANNNFITASAVRTKHKFEASYGYYEASIKYPAIKPDQSGAWGAFWLMYHHSNLEGGRDGTEIDIIETAGVHNGRSASALHWNGYESNHSSTGIAGYGTAGSNADSFYVSPSGTIYDGEFHTYALEWTPNEYIIYIDDAVMGRITQQELNALNVKGLGPAWICENPLYLKLSIESSAPTNGNNWNMGWGGPVAPGVWEDYMVVDYVAVYDRPKNAAAVYTADHVTLETEPVYNAQEQKWQIAATLKNVYAFDQSAVYSGEVTLDPAYSGIISGTTEQRYESLAYGESLTLYFDIDMEAYLAADKAHAVIGFNYTIDGYSDYASAQTKFGYIEAAPASDDDVWADSAAVDFAKGISDAATFPAAADLSAVGKFAWDSENLYVKIDVTDDVHNQTFAGGNDWQGDGIQIAANNNLGHREMGFFLRSDNGAVSAYCYSNSTGASGGTGNISGDYVTLSIVRDETAKTTIYEIAIKWSYLGIDGSGLNAGDTARIAVTINDNDGAGRKFISLFDGITSGNDKKGVDTGYLVLSGKEGSGLTPEAEALKNALAEVSALLADVKTVLAKPRGTNMTANLWANALTAFVPRLEAFDAAYDDFDGEESIIIDDIVFGADDVNNWLVNVRNIYNLLNAIV